MSGSSTMSMNLWQEMLEGKDGEPVNDLLKRQYDVVYGSWPSSYDEIALALDKNNELDDMTLYALGLESKSEMDAIRDAAANGTPLETKDEKWSYQDVCGREFRVIPSFACYSYDADTGVYTDLRTTETGLRYLYDNGITLKVTGIIRPNADAQTSQERPCSCSENRVIFTGGLCGKSVQPAFHPQSAFEGGSLCGFY